MAQAHPQGSYGRGPYQQPAAGPYGQQAPPYPPQPYPYAQQAYPRPPYPSQPYAEQQPYPQHPQPQQSHYPQSPHPGHGPQLPPAPEEAGDGRRILAAVLDGVFALVAGFAAAKSSSQHGGSAGAYFGLLLAVSVGFSFVNHVVLARLLGFSLGKGLLAARVIRYKDVSRPGTWRLARRWLLGFVMLPIGLMLEELEPEEACGVRVVRRKHLDGWKRRAGRLG
ncbi:RDD family protein [Kitasatospora sp. NBC_00240]|uniref:RDD family protein n=1 Tax=Kitasatospora sp. NBC_00240 TaxID=2903567 RepID=UPI00225380FD|nr:RDD family protein [Kitasatospora sp. NBC_00240]MCX5213020.1 RDD family protein [Kitasatospora sp. NBC_00240]